MGMETPLKKWKIRGHRIEAFTLRCAAAMLAATLNIAVGQELPKWRHGIVEAKSDAGIVMMASTREFARKQGIDLQYVQFNSDALALKALVAGGLDSYEGSPGSPITAASKGVDIKIVGCYWPGLTYGIFHKEYDQVCQRSHRQDHRHIRTELFAGHFYASCFTKKRYQAFASSLRGARR